MQQFGLQQFLNLINQGGAANLNLVSKPIKQQLFSKQQFETYSDQLKIIYQHCFNDEENPLQLEKVVPLKLIKTKVPVCNKPFSEGQIVYRCYDCFLHEAAVFCQNCFEKGSHSGHRFKKNPSWGGNCDCGNPLAVKKESFCVDHSGTVQIPEIPENQRKLFNEIIGYMIKWYLMLAIRKEDCAQTYGRALFTYLKTLNTNSIYYNLLTFHLITKKSKDGLNFLSQLLLIKSVRISKIVNQIFFLMFNLQQFKNILAYQFLKTYNTCIGFQSTVYHSLFIQLFANDSVVFKVVNQMQEIIFVTKEKFDLQKYLHDLEFICSINNEPAFAFLNSYFRKNKYIPLTFLYYIEQKGELKQEMHKVDIVSTYINLQNISYSTYTHILEKVKDNEELLRLTTRGLYEAVTSKSYSYIQNVAVLPYHRIFGLALFMNFKGNFSQMTVKSVSQLLQIQQESVIKMCLEISQKFIKCLWDFAQTYHRRNYFDNYIVLYVRKGLRIIRYDQILLKEAASILSSVGMSLEPILENLLQKQKQQLEIRNNKNEYFTEIIKTWLTLCSLLTQICVTKTAEIMFNNDLQLNNKQIQQDRIKLFKQIIKRIGPITIQQITVLSYYFFGAVNDEFLLKHVTYNKSTKKYEISETVNNNDDFPFIYDYYTSKKRTGQQVIKEDLKQNIIKLIESEKKKLVIKLPIKLNHFFSVEFLSKILNFMIENESLLIQTQKVAIEQDFLCLLSKLSPFIDESQYEKIKLIIQDITQGKKQRKQSIQEVEILRQQSLKQNAKLKKQKFLKKQNKALQKFYIQIEEPRMQIKQEETVCLICRQKLQRTMEDQSQEESLCYFSCLKMKRFISYAGIGQQLGILYDTCFHATHEQCYNKANSQIRTIECPLCKTLSNSLLVADQNHRSKTFSHTMEKNTISINHLEKVYSLEPSKGFPKQLSLFKSMVDCMIEYIGFVGLLNKQAFESKFYKICRQLNKQLKMQWKILQTSIKNQLIRLMVLQSKSLQSSEQIKGTPSIIKRCILATIMNNVQGKQLSLKNIQNIYLPRMNKQDFESLKDNMMKIFDMKQEQNKSEMQIQSNNQIQPLKFPYKFFNPPKNIRQLIELRDKITLQNCKNGHNVFLCCLCEKAICVQCKGFDKHIFSHGADYMLFSLLSGEIQICGDRRMSLPCLYENKVGVTWNQDKQMDGFQLNKQFYDQLCRNVAFHTIEDLIRAKMPKIFQTAEVGFRIFNPV